MAPDCLAWSIAINPSPENAASTGPPRPPRPGRRSVRRPEIVVDLGALQHARVVGIADLGLRVELEHLPAPLAVAVPRLLYPAERQMSLGADGRRVHVRDAVV